MALNHLLEDNEMGFRATAERSFSDKVMADYNALGKQIGGNHYKQFKIQPVEFCFVNDIPYIEATCIKYLCRWRNKGGFEDLDKVVHFVNLLKELEGKK